MILRSISGMQKEIDREMMQPFEKGKNDCLSFCLAAIKGLGVNISDFEAYNGIEPKKPYNEFISFCNGQKWNQIKPNEADTGSIGLMRINDQFCPAVFVGGLFVLRTESGILTLPYTSCVLCYRTVV